MLSKIRGFVFFVPLTLLVATVSASIVNYDEFISAIAGVNAWILDQFAWAFNVGAFVALAVLLVVALSPIGKVRIGGRFAEPILSRWNWFAITLCTTIAIGILFWATAEPITHFNRPPAFSGADPRSPEAATFAMSSLFLHWSITPYALYAVPALAFALAHHNLGAPYSLSGPLSLALGPLARGPGAAVIDAVAVFALVAGIAASLGAGALTLAGGLASMTALESGPMLRGLVMAAIVLAFVGSSVSGLQRGIRFLSDLNAKFFFALVAIVLVAGPTGEMLAAGGRGLVQYVAEFVPRSVDFTSGRDPWIRDWTVFYWANWLAWAPITALFLGRISIGYTVREFLLVNLLAPAVFAIGWMTVFGGTALILDAAPSAPLSAALASDGPEALIYVVLETLPYAGALVAVFVLLSFVSFVTAADSNTTSISAVCMTPEGHAHARRATLVVKMMWGVIIGLVAWIMTATNGVDGVRMISVLGGFPALAILFGSAIALLRLAAFGPARLSRDPTRAGASQGAQPAGAKPAQKPAHRPV